MPEIDVVVPVLGRPQNAEPLVESLAASGADARLVAVPSTFDRPTKDAWAAVAASGPPVPVVVLPLGTEPGSFAQKVNHAHRLLGAVLSPAPWLMLCGDDVRFHPGWAQAALRCADKYNASVVGTNTAGPTPDGGTPHPLIRRDYITERGASWDGPGSVCHEGYRHNFVDVEIATLAIHRGVFFHCVASVVEHHCPYQGKADQDPTYQISSDTVDGDRALWHERSARFADYR